MAPRRRPKPATACAAAPAGIRMPWPSGESHDETWPFGRSGPKSFRILIKFLAYHNEAYNQLLFYFVTQLLLGVGL